MNIQKYKYTEILGKKTEDGKKLILQADDIQKDCGKKSDLIKMVDHFFTVEKGEFPDIADLKFQRKPLGTTVYSPLTIGSAVGVTALAANLLLIGISASYSINSAVYSRIRLYDCIGVRAILF